MAESIDVQASRRWQTVIRATHEPSDRLLFEINITWISTLYRKLIGAIELVGQSHFDIQDFVPLSCTALAVYSLESLKQFPNIFFAEVLDCFRAPVVRHWRYLLQCFTIVLPVMTSVYGVAFVAARMFALQPKEAWILACFLAVFVIEVVIFPFVVFVGFLLWILNLVASSSILILTSLIWILCVLLSHTMRTVLKPHIMNCELEYES